MPAKMILTLLFFVSLCVVVILAIRALPQRLNGDTPGTREEILVAATALQIGTLLRAKDVTWQQSGASAGLGQIACRRTAAGSPNLELDQQARAEVYGAALRSSVTAGEPVSRGAIVKPGDRDFLQVVLSPQARAIAIPVTTGGASTGILYPGDRVDVILTQTFKNDPPLARRSVGETVVENLRVLAIDALESRPNGTANGFGRTVTLEVTPEQAERVNVATELGKLSLTLLLDRTMALHGERLFVLSAEEPLRVDSEFTAQAVDKLVGVLRTQFHYIVADVPRIPGSAYWQALDTADLRIIVADQTLRSVRDTVRLREAFNTGRAEHSNMLVVNRIGEGGRRAMTLAEMAKVTLQPNFVIPFRPSLFTAPGPLRRGALTEVVGALAGEISGRATARKRWWRFAT